METIRVGDKCIIKQDKTNKSVEAEVFDFKEKQNLTVVLNKSVKLNMVWNGKIYEGKGFPPDIEVKVTPSMVYPSKGVMVDPQLEKAISLLPK